MSRFCPIFCPMFIKVLSMSNICPNYFSLTQFCQIIVHILYKMFTNCPRVDLFFPKFFVLDKFWTKKCPSYVHVLLKCFHWNIGDIWQNCLSNLCQDFSMSNCSNCVQFICSHTVLSVISVIGPTFVYIQIWSNGCQNKEGTIIIYTGRPGLDFEKSWTIPRYDPSLYNLWQCLELD